ncbi:carboxypeptidase-like regulatory domain-containing protein, partial [Bacteroides fragilis]
MTKRTNLFPSLIKTREMNCLKIAGASLLLLCISPQFAVADGLKQDAVTIMQQQNLKVSGVVTDEAGEPLIGVSVLVKGTTLGNITDLNGRFSLDVPEGSILEISYIGYKTQSIKAQREPMNIVLKEDAQKLDEVVV